MNENNKKNIEKLQNEFSTQFDIVYAELISGKYNNWFFGIHRFPEIAQDYFADNAIKKYTTDGKIYFDLQGNPEITHSFAGEDKIPPSINLEGLFEKVETNHPRWILMKQMHPIWTDNNLSLAEKDLEVQEIQNKFCSKSTSANISEDEFKKIKSDYDALKKEPKKSSEHWAEKRVRIISIALNIFSRDPGSYTKSNKTIHQYGLAQKVVDEWDKFEFDEGVTSHYKQKPSQEKVKTCISKALNLKGL